MPNRKFSSAKPFVVALLASVLAITTISAPAQAADEPQGKASTPPRKKKSKKQKKISVPVNVLGLVPLYDLANMTNMPIGGSVGFGYNVYPHVETYLRAGYQFGIPTKVNGLDSTVDFLPVMVGGRYYIDKFSGPYVGAEIGLSAYQVSSSQASDMNPRLGGAAGLGYVVSEELPIHIGAQVTFINMLRVEINEPPLSRSNRQICFKLLFNTL